jgi:TonB family protein
MIFPLFFACLAVSAQDIKTAPQHLRFEIQHASLTLELDRAILVLKQGLKDRWQTRDQYLMAFEKTLGTDPTGRPVTEAKGQVKCAIGSHLRIHQMWDEGSPIEVEVHRTIADFTRDRDNQAVELLRSPCAIPAPLKVRVSAGVATSMLETKIDPVYPAKAPKNHVLSRVVLRATISRKGSPENLRVISGPPMLWQAALDAVRHWTYRPYRLNDKQIEVETTINVVFAPED